MADKDEKKKPSFKKNKKKRKAENAPAPSKETKKDAKTLRTKSQKAIDKALNY